MHHNLEIQPSLDRITVLLIAAEQQVRASISYKLHRQGFAVQPLSSVSEIALRDYSSADVFLAWDEGDLIARLRELLSVECHWVPIVGISEHPPVQRVVAALKAGAINYVDWAGNLEALLKALSAAAEARRQYLPRERRQAHGRRQLATLSVRERQVLAALILGMANKDIGDLLGISPRTVEIHRAAMMRKLGVHHSAEAIRIRIEAGLEPDRIGGPDGTATSLLDEHLFLDLPVAQNASAN